LNQLLIKGAAFLTNLGHALAQGNASPHEVMEKQMKTMIGKDETTGKPYLKIPLPEPEMVQDLLSALGGLLVGVFGKKS
jgi:hypothetical protein